MDRTWILLGMMGSGKSSVGQALAEISGRDFADTDKLLSYRLGRPITDLFRLYGEEAFRAQETSILKSLQPGKSVLATGGGIILKPANWIELKRLGITIFLDVPTPALLERVERGKKRRPLIQAEDWQTTYVEMLEMRRPLYEQADIHVRIVEEDIEAVAIQIRDRVEAYELGN